MLRDALAVQLEMAWSLASLHLEGLTTEECLWRPAAVGLHVHEQSDGTWVADWPEHEGYNVGPPSIAWVRWHLGFWWSKVLDPTVEREATFWPGTAVATREWVIGLHARWVDLVAGANLDSTTVRRWPVVDRPFYARFLYAVR